jgi:GntR family transcriptional repressor for pyruvate dehydrogenase complex
MGGIDMEPVKRVRVVDSVSEKLVSAISEGRFDAGAKLPPEHDLAEMLQVSRNALREAVRQLETMGIVTVRHGDGTYVNRVTGNSLVTRALQFFRLGGTTLIDLVEAREAIEVTAAMLAAERAGAGEVEALLQLVRDMDNLIAKPGDYVEKDFAFHVMVVEASKNQVLIELFSTIQDILMVQLRKIMELYGVTKDSYGYHREVAFAIADKDSEAAGSAMRDHFRKVAKPYVAKVVNDPHLNSGGEGLT